jgi:probable rRNA maturation factor
LISFHAEGVSFNLKNNTAIKDWIISTISKEDKKVGEITYVFCSDKYLHKINLEHLKHDTYTDIITFDYTDGRTVGADIFISIERVTENAQTYKSTFDKELSRVIIHGVLHLLGYKDKTIEEAKRMREKEDFYLTLLPL